eukprot:664687-Pyramimonas_sp.AAC.1
MHVKEWTHICFKRKWYYAARNAGHCADKMDEALYTSGSERARRTTSKTTTRRSAKYLGRSYSA